MALPPPDQVEDLTDEDFFDKLVGDDDSGITGSQSPPTDLVRAVSSLSIGDVGESLDDAGEGGSAAGDDDLKANSILPAPEESDKFASTEPGTGAVSQIETPSPSTEKHSGTKVKEVQWSAFNADFQQADSDGFGSYSDFWADNSEGPAEFLQNDNEVNSAFMEKSNGESSMGMSASGQEESQFYNSSYDQAADGHDLQYWENLYPGWKYDASTGQWYQLEGYDISTNAESDVYTNTTSVQSDGYNASVNVQSGSNAAVNSQLDSHTMANVDGQHGFHGNTQVASDGFVVDQRSDISYIQQASSSAVDKIAEDSSVASVQWNQVSQENAGYPSNMVFDPQYPDWYYDTNTQQWQTLESYFQSLSQAAGSLPSQLIQNSSNGYGNSSLYNGVNHSENSTMQSQSYHQTGANWQGSTNNYSLQNSWQQPEEFGKDVSDFYGNQQMGSSYGSGMQTMNKSKQETSYKSFEPGKSHVYGISNGVSGYQSFNPSENMYQYSQPKVENTLQAHLSSSGSYYGNQNSGYSQQSFQSTGGLHTPLPLANAISEGRSSAGRPPHALVTFGFGGKLIVMKDTNSFGPNLDYGSQDAAKGAISVFNLSEVVCDKIDGTNGGGGSYFHTLCHQSFPGPLVGGNAGTKDVNKWIDEKVQECQAPLLDERKGELLKMLISLLKISLQHYGKLRSPFVAGSSLEESDGPESDVTKLFASARKNHPHLGEYGSYTHCVQSLPSEGQARTTAVEVQNLLVSGRRKEALQRAQDGQLWGPALVLAAQLGDKFYVDTVKQMAHRQFLFGSPLRTLCLLIAGQPADVFSADNFVDMGMPGATNAFQQPPRVLTNSMLDDWEENLAIITANRTKDDELVIIHLGDCLWKERGEVTAAHTCYLVAEANFEPYSDSARLCLVGADHWKCPRTFASPEAIQRTELYEYSKVLGNSQFILLPFQPYKLIYAYMLAEVGKVSESLRYCQASLKVLRNSGRAPEVEAWKSLFSSLEERLRTHQQGGYGTNLAPGKFVGKLFTSIDRSIHRMIGAPPAPLPPTPQMSLNGKELNAVVPKVASSQSTMAMSSLIPSASVETMSEWEGDSSRKIMHNRSISEPDFGRSPKQGSSVDSISPEGQHKVSTSRFGRIGSQLIQKTMGWVSRSRSDRQAKLGQSNKFYYDEKLKRWVEEGTEPPAAEVALAPPPMLASYQNGISDHNVNSSFQSQSLPANGGSEIRSPSVTEPSSGMPPVPPTTNQFSSRSRMGVRSRYVDTFNKGGGASTNSFTTPTVPSVKPPMAGKFFVPTAPSASDGQQADAAESIPEADANSEPSTSGMQDKSFASPPPAMQRFPSMDNIAHNGNLTGSALQVSDGPPISHARAASWGGSYSDVFKPKMPEEKLSRGLGMQTSFMPVDLSAKQLSSSYLQPNGGGSSGVSGDDLHEVEL
ncbi:protein transport protein SEC16B homolog [Dioscorea cayenensis subsp. rotundata]|uniref:Protein transport protein sec16 n=1 Tax=Dioscorea cayennensis subsp. rotundata TaxID=55577 RepID=A0AB40B560_DIOCR|nr:protein transport protein SEC16B homolog [Dioscorea cayenensis subsp. rotundata]